MIKKVVRVDGWSSLGSQAPEELSTRASTLVLSTI